MNADVEPSASSPLILAIDNYDSFTYNLVQHVGQCGAEVVVRRNDAIAVGEIAAMAPSGILLSPGPCTPLQSGVCLEVLAAGLQGPSGPLAGIPIFGVCLGLQAMAHTAGGDVVRARRLRHGKASLVRHDGMGAFQGVPSPFSAIRYHSLIVSPDAVPTEYEITATAEDDGEIMALRHRTLPIEGVQFHPESILTEHGLKIVENWVRRCTGASRTASPG